MTQAAARVSRQSVRHSHGLLHSTDKLQHGLLPAWQRACTLLVDRPYFTAAQQPKSLPSAARSQNAHNAVTRLSLPRRRAAMLVALLPVTGSTQQTVLHALMSSKV
jgi:hypothetical protein